MRTASTIARTGLAALALTLAGCGPSGLAPYDDSTKYRVDNNSTGFTLTIDYSRRNFIWDPEAVREACKNKLVTVAEELAAKRDRRIRRLEEQQIETKVGRNEHSNMSFCTATAPVLWQ